MTLRKGGIRAARPALPARPRALLPLPHVRPPAPATSCASPTSRSCAARWRRACGATASRRCTRSSRARPLQQPDRVRIRAWAEVDRPLHDRRPALRGRPLAVLRVDARLRREAPRLARRQPLHVLLLRTYRIPRPVTVKVKDEYMGPHAWVELQRELPFEGTPVLSDAEFERASEEIRAITARSRASARMPASRSSSSAGGRSLRARAARALRAPASRADSGTSTSRGPAARKSGTSKPPRAALQARDALLEQQPLDQLGLGLVGGAGDLHERALGVLRLDLARARCWRSLASRSRARA